MASCKGIQQVAHVFIISSELANGRCPKVAQIVVPSGAQHKLLIVGACATWDNDLVYFICPRPNLDQRTVKPKFSKLLLVTWLSVSDVVVSRRFVK